MSISVSSWVFITFIFSIIILPYIGVASQHCKNFSCGKFQNLNYPFGRIGSNCGDPDFQLLDCDGEGGPYLRFNYTDKGGLTFPLKNLYPWNAKHKPAVVLLEIALNTTTDDCHSPLLHLKSGNFTYGSNYSFTVQNDSTMQYFFCDKYLINSSAQACGFHWFPSLQYNKAQCEDSDEHIVTFPEAKLKSPISDELIKSVGFLVEAKIYPPRTEECFDCLYGSQSNSCGYNSTYNFQCFPPAKTIRTELIIGGAVGATAGVFLFGLVLIFLIKRRRRRRASKRESFSRGNSFLPFSLTSYSKDEEYGPDSLGSMPIFSYEELRDATNSFSDRNEIGEGGFGAVYHGRLRDGRQVAVKKLYQHHSRRVGQFLKEAKIYTNLLHPNVVRLYGCTSPNSPELLLVFEYVPNGTLGDHLHGDRRGGDGGLPLSTRLKIILQTAEALFFLHNNDPPVFHRDVKSLNILLDEHMDAKVADFGLCRPVPVNATHVTTAPQGTPGYVDPEYHQCYQLTEKSDVYSFGVVLVEIISGKTAVDINRERRFINLADMAVSKIQEGALEELLDPGLQSVIRNDEGARDVVSCLAELAFRCLASEREDRPAMKEVVGVLRDLRDKVVECKDKKKNGLAPLSPVSVQNKWPSTATTPNSSAN